MNCRSVRREEEEEEAPYEKGSENSKQSLVYQVMPVKMLRVHKEARAKRFRLNSCLFPHLPGIFTRGKKDINVEGYSTNFIESGKSNFFHGN